MHGGDCEAIGAARRPLWADTRHVMVHELRTFLQIYAQRPFTANTGGMRADHSFALWYVLRSLRPKPTTVIESGVHQGHSTWLIQSALPEAQIISLSPTTPVWRTDRATYLTGSNFTDFGHVDWALWGLHIDRTVVLLDDHQSSLRRIFREGNRYFKRFVVEDNYPAFGGDNLSMKWLCDVRSEEKWRGAINDNFAKIKINQSWSEHVKEATEATSQIKWYAEMPPIAHQNLTGQTRYDPENATPALITDRRLFEGFIQGMELEEFVMYTHFCYVELK